MSAAVAAMHLDTLHEEAADVTGAHRAFQRLEEARPAGAALKLGIRGKQVLAAAGADELAVALFRVQRAGAGALGAVLAQHLVLRRGKLRAPLLLGVGVGKRLGIGRVRRAEQRHWPASS